LIGQGNEALGRGEPSAPSPLAQARRLSGLEEEVRSKYEATP